MVCISTWSTRGRSFHGLIKHLNLEAQSLMGVPMFHCVSQGSVSHRVVREIAGLTFRQRPFNQLRGQAEFIRDLACIESRDNDCVPPAASLLIPGETRLAPLISPVIR